MDQSQKRDAGKFDPLMIDEDLANALEVENAVLEFGKAKYGSRGGWMKVDMQRYASAEARHRRARMKMGISSVDEETGLLHIAHEIINLQFLLEMHIRANPGFDFTTYKEPVLAAGAQMQDTLDRKAELRNPLHISELHFPLHVSKLPSPLHSKPAPIKTMPMSMPPMEQQPDYHTKYDIRKVYASHGRDGSNSLD